MQTQATLCVCFTKINTKLFFVEPKLPLILKLKNHFSHYQHEMMNYYQHQKL